MSEKASMSWSGFWALFDDSDQAERASLAQQIDLDRWLPRLSWEAKLEVLKDAPEPVVQYYWGILELPAKKKFLRYHGVEIRKSIGGRPNRSMFALPKGF